MVQPVSEEHLCLINLPISICDEEAASRAPGHAPHLNVPKPLVLVVFFFSYSSQRESSVAAVMCALECLDSGLLSAK